MAESGIDLIRHALELAREHGFNEVELEAGELSFEAKLEPAPKAAPVASSQQEPSADETPMTPPEKDIVSPVVGYYRTGTTPLKVGTGIRKGDAIASILALGISNDLESPFSGEVVEVLVRNEQAVEYGQVLARVKVS